MSLQHISKQGQEIAQKLIDAADLPETYALLKGEFSTLAANERRDIVENIVGDLTEPEVLGQVYITAAIKPYDTDENLSPYIITEFYAAFTAAAKKSDAPTQEDLPPVLREIDTQISALTEEEFRTPRLLSQTLQNAIAKYLPADHNAHDAVDATYTNPFQTDPNSAENNTDKNDATSQPPSHECLRTYLKNKP